MNPYRASAQPPIVPLAVEPDPFPPEDRDVDELIAILKKLALAPDDTLSLVPFVPFRSVRVRETYFRTLARLLNGAA